MDEHRHDIGDSCFYYDYVLSDYTCGCIVTRIIKQHWSIMNLMLLFMEFVDMAFKVRNMWRYERVMECMKNQLVGSIFEKIFWQQTRLSYDTFCNID
jgi:hypothetical protein